METLRQPADNATFSSSPAFGTPLHPIQPTQAQRPPPPPALKPAIPTILPISLPPPTLRPLAFRTFTKKYNLTLNSSALQALASFVGRHCGTGWREEGTGEKVLEEVAKLWKLESGPVIVEDGGKLKGILKTLEGCMSGGRMGQVKSSSSNLSRQSSFAFGNDSAVDLSHTSRRPSLDGRHHSFGMSKLHVEQDDDDDHEDANRDARSWLKVISAFDQPRFSYDTDKKHFVPLTNKPSLFPSPAHKTALFRERYNIIHQRVLRNAAFQSPSFSHTTTLSRTHTTATPPSHKITPIANLLGRGSTPHLLLALLVIAPTGNLALNDPTGSIPLSLHHASPPPSKTTAHFCPGMILLLDGIYDETWSGPGSSGLGNTGGIGGTIGGRFIAFSISGPPVEKRDIALGINLNPGDVGGGFGWTDFLGLGSERAVGDRMRRLEQRLLSPQAMSASRRKMVIMSEVVLDEPQTLSALRKVLEQYSPSHSSDDNDHEAPMAFLLTGNFTSQPALANAGTGSIEAKELFDQLAAVLADFPALLRSSTWIFVPGDNDPWNSAFSAGASTLVPREGVPEVFTSRVRRVFAAARADGGEGVGNGEAVWTSNPARVSLFGMAQEVLVWRDDVGGRLRRSAVRVGERGGGGGEVGDGDDGDGGGDVVMSGALPTTENAATQLDLDPDPEVAEAMSLDPPTAPSEQADHATNEAKKTILSLLPQSTLSPFPPSQRPTHWHYASSALSLSPLPHTLVLADAEAEPFQVTFEGCHVLNPGRLVVGGGGSGGKKRRVQWCEYDFWGRRGVGRSAWVE